MKALILTYDRQIGLADLVIRSYAKLWPDNPFEYLVPLNDPAAGGVLVQGAPVRFVASPSPVRETMAALLGEVRDDEWVFWAIDDRYPVWLDAGRLSRLADDITRGAFDAFNGVRLLHWREELEGELVDTPHGPFRRLRPDGTYGFWHHHFVRAGLLRRSFLADELRGVTDIRAINQGLQAMAPLSFMHDVLVPAAGNLVHLDEPLVAGQLTRNGLQALQAFGCRVPDYGVLDKECGFFDQVSQTRANPQAPRVIQGARR